VAASGQRRLAGARTTGMLMKSLLATALLLHVATANAQLPPRTFADIPFWADMALRAAGLEQRFTLTSELNPIYAFGDFDRDGLLDLAVEIKDTGGLRCGLAIVHRIDGAVHIVGAGQSVGNGRDALRCGAAWGVQSAAHHHRGFRHGPDLLYVTKEFGADGGWLVWDGASYVWVKAD